MARGFACAGCGARQPPGATSCGRCGRVFPPAAPDTWQRRAGITGWSLHGVLKGLLGLWAIGYLVVACSPMLAATQGSAGAVAGGLTSVLVGSVLFGPWIVGIIVLGVLVLVTK